MRVSLLFAFLFLAENCSQQPNQEIQSSYIFDTTMLISLSIDSLHQRDIEMCQIYADSLNLWKGDALPKFLERDIEAEHQDFGEDIHHLLSFRKTMFDRVYSRKVLATILNSNTPFYSAKPHASRILYATLSLRELAKIRYDGLLEK